MGPIRSVWILSTATPHRPVRVMIYHHSFHPDATMNTFIVMPRPANKLQPSARLGRLLHSFPINAADALPFNLKMGHIAFEQNVGKGSDFRRRVPLIDIIDPGQFTLPLSPEPHAPPGRTPPLPLSFQGYSWSSSSVFRRPIPLHKP